MLLPITKVDKSLSTKLDRIDIRKDKGIVKFIYTDNYWEIQLDGQTGDVLQINQRKSDFVEDIHDGSFLDYYFKTEGEPIKLIYTKSCITTALNFHLRTHLISISVNCYTFWIPSCLFIS